MYPDSEPVENGPLKPVMTLKARVSQVRNLPKGATVSYGRTYRAEEGITSAVIPAGYADGYPRRLSNMGKVFINGKAYSQIGRICMDVCMADVTINYELTCLVTERANRVYVNN